MLVTGGPPNFGGGGIPHRIMVSSPSVPSLRTTGSTEAGTNFTSNQVTIRGEERVALAVKQPLALIYGAMP
jgi:hypothetical protein